MLLFLFNPIFLKTFRAVTGRVIPRDAVFVEFSVVLDFRFDRVFSCLQFYILIDKMDGSDSLPGRLYRTIVDLEIRLPSIGINR